MKGVGQICEREKITMTVLYEIVPCNRQTYSTTPNYTGVCFGVAKLYPRYSLVYENHSQIMSQYSLATIFICQNIPPVQFGYDFLTINCTEVESFFMYILAVTTGTQLKRHTISICTHGTDLQLVNVHKSEVDSSPLETFQG